MRTPFVVLPAVAAAALLLASTREAHAGPYLGVDLDLGTAFQNQVDFSYGLGARLGFKAHLGDFVYLLPEIGGHYMSFGSRNGAEFGHAGDVNIGARLGLQGIVQPNVFGHVGVGFVGDSRLGPSADIGVGLDFRIVPMFTLGPQIAYHAITVTEGGDAAKWLSFGLTAGFNFGAREERRR